MTTLRDTQPVVLVNGSPVEFGSCIFDILSASVSASPVWFGHAFVPVRVSLSHEPYELALDSAPVEAAPAAPDFKQDVHFGPCSHAM